ncbi:hypothetical protein HII31_00456 [Pseudocercospora fuligena]|uniref:Uncharacterized protein n=1 Tax=Pseudocercospora fuligena TaxID=685502 RepID=A0A8H6VNA2_9PEZI|nr:hypothetical protein HII31_00456 [Pseudocercospora fuligena]
MNSEGWKPEARWQSLLRLWLPAVVSFLLLSFIVGYFGIVQKSAKLHASAALFCTPDAHVLLSAIHDDLTNMWSPRTALWITLGFGQFTFAGAKALDFAWDLCIGRGGQALIAYFTYPCIRRALYRAVTTFNVYMPMYTAVAFDKVSLTTAWAIVCNKSDKKVGFSLCWRYFLMIPILAYILLFPSFISLMTGYQATLIPLVRLSDGNYMNASLLQVPTIVAVDGSRIGLTDMMASTPNDSWSQLVHDYQTTWSHFAEQVHDMDIAGRNVSTKCFNSSNNQYNNSDACYFSASQNGSQHYDYSYSYLWGTVNSTITISGKTWDLKSDLLSVAVNGQMSGSGELYFSSGSTGFNSSYLMATSQCQPASTYMWGFSFLMLFIFCLLTAVFVSLLSWICYDSYWWSPADRYEQQISTYRDILDIGEEIRRTLGAESRELNGVELNGKELTRKIKEDRNGLRISADLLLPSRADQMKRLEEPMLPMQRVKSGPKYAAVLEEEH